MKYQTFELRKENKNVKLTTYILDEEITHHGHIKRPAMVVFPGGGYVSLAHKESEPIVARFLGMGFNVFLLDYSVAWDKRPDENRPKPVLNEGYTLEKSLEDAEKAIDIIHEHAEEWFIDEKRIYAVGFSAGAHLVGMLAENYQEKANLRGIILGYPLVSPNSYDGATEMLKQVDAQKWGSLIDNILPNMPRTFVWQTNDDTVVRPNLTTKFVMKLQENHIPVEYHLYQTGDHGMALADRTSAARLVDLNYPASKWIDAAKIWLDLDQKELKLIPDNRE